jgi:hypothetical protein
MDKPKCTRIQKYQRDFDVEARVEGRVSDL